MGKRHILTKILAKKTILTFYCLNKIFQAFTPIIPQLREFRITRTT